MPMARKRTAPNYLRTQLILLAIIVGISALLLGGRAFFAYRHEAVRDADPVSVTENPLDPPGVVDPVQTAAPIESVKPEQPAKPERPATPAQPAKPAQPATPAQPARSTGAVTRTVTPVKPSESVSVPLPATSSHPDPSVHAMSVHKGTIILVFDDAGHNLSQLEAFLRLPFPCTIAVLPGLEYSAEAARRIRAAGKELILHQPMQAVNLSTNPGPSAILPGMKRSEITDLLARNLAEVGPVAGMNNHEGSLITGDPDMMDIVLDVVRDRGIYFLDSRTTAHTAVPAVAREKQMTIWERSVFLDNSQDKSSIIDAVQNGMKIAERRGAAIMIGHIWSSQLADILTEMYPELVREGFSLSTISRIALSEDYDE